ncbi:MAG: hypothetical protein ABRQ39_32755, partial [Candidatus Eremiobacterota bacterium]
MTHIERRYETYKQDEQNLTVYRAAGGYRVNNHRPCRWLWGTRQHLLTMSFVVVFPKPQLLS